MTLGAFLRLVWPTIGSYCLVTTKMIGIKEVYIHHSYATIDEAITRGYELAPHETLFFSVLSLKEREIVTQLAEPDQYGRSVRKQYRITPNMLASRVLIFDLDVGAGADKYESQTEAYEALSRFCFAMGLSRPTVVSSGGGLHIYWRLGRDITAEEYVQLEARLKGCAKTLGMRYDPTRTTDVASVLRVVGSFNRKTAELREVKVIQIGDDTEYETMHALLHQQASRLKAVVEVPNIKRTITTPGSLPEQKIINFTPEPLSAVMAACEQVRTVVESYYDPSHPLHGQDNLGNPTWYNTMPAVVGYCQNGPEIVRELNALCPRGSSDVEAKIVQALRVGAPVSCTTIADKSQLGDAPCKRCLHYGKAKNPLMASRTSVNVPIPATALVQQPALPPPPPPAAPGAPPPPPPPPPVGVGIVLPPQLVPPPPGYRITREFRVVRIELDEDGTEVPELVLPWAIYPVSIQCLPDRTGFATEWVSLGLDDKGRFLHPQTLLIPNKDIYEDREMRKHLLDRGWNIPYDLWREAMRYISAYAHQMQKVTDTMVQRESLGWADDGSAFVLPDKTYHADKSVSVSNMVVSETARAVLPGGTMAKQMEALGFYFDDPTAIVQQAMLLSSLGSILVRFSGQVGLHVAMVGESGVAKSTLLNACASLWGAYDKYVLNGTQGGSTKNHVGNRIAFNSNLPTCVDEVTHMEPNEAATLAMRSSQAAGRGRLNPDGTEKRQIGGDRSSIIMTTSNRSMYELLAEDTAARSAGFMRVIEIEMLAPLVLRNVESRDMTISLLHNHGHVGRAFARFVTENQALAEQLVKGAMARVERELGTDSSERFRVVWIAVVVAAGEILRLMGLCDPQVEEIYAWATTIIVPELRRGVEANIAQAPELMSAIVRRTNGMLATINKHGQTIDCPDHGEVQGMINEQTGKLCISSQIVREQLRKLGASKSMFDKSLADAGSLYLGEGKVAVPTRGGPWVRTLCYVFDLNHPTLRNGGTPLVVVGGTAATGLSTAAGPA